MFVLLQEFYSDLDPNALRLIRPSKFVFLCGGELDEGDPDKYVSLRDFIVKSVTSTIDNSFVLAEAANKLYESTKYTDLISFEEDIARIAAVILVVAESPGSLAELGAFASYNPLSSNLRLIVPSKHEADKSFIREGPIRRLQRRGASFVAYFEWAFDPAGRINSSISTHRDAILEFVNGQVKRAPKKQLLKERQDLRPFYVLL